MEGVIVDAVVGSLVENLISLLTDKFAQIKGVKNDVEKLESTLSAIQAVLEDAEEKQITSKPITNWLRKLKDATFDAEDVLDAWSLEIQQRELDFANMGCSSKVSHSLSSCFCFKSILFRRRIAKTIKDILGKFHAIAEEKSQFHLNTGDISQSRSHFNKERETFSMITEPHIYGREENKKKIVDILVTDFVNRENVSVCSIVGMGGLGKTTLAKSIYNDGSVQRHFEEVKIWVCVSDPFDLERVLKKILEPFHGKACDLVSLEAVSRRVKEILNGKRYLIVLDDVWTEKEDEWNQLSAVLKGGAKGSSILLTTRSQEAASMTGTIQPYRLGALSDGDCFSLFKNHALGDKGEEGHPNLMAIGKEIANKCKGIPLVAKSLGSCLRSKTDENQWKRIRDSEIWSLDETRENTKILATLRLSYNHLASPLKQCFAYCSLFPKDFEIQRIELIYLWVANGFIKSQEKLELEEVGDEIFNELLRMSFFQDTEEDWYGNIKTCKMHDFMHDLATSVSAHECLIAKADDTKQVPKTVRHLTLLQAPTNLGHFLSPQPSLRTLYFFGSTDFRFSSTLRVLSLKKTGIERLPSSVCDLKHLRFLDLFGNRLACLPESFAKLRNLQFLDLSGNNRIRTLPLPVCNLEHLRYLNVSHCKINGSLPESIHGLKSLRSLNLSGNRLITEIPDSIGNLEHLRYLNLSSCKRITSLPESICGLHNLQSLILECCPGLQALPENMKKMSSLRHINNSLCGGLRKMPVGIGELKCLQTLGLFVVPPIGGDGAGISELQGLDQLRGRLEIRGLENVRTGADAQTAMLANKKYLRELQLKWSNSSDDSLQVKNSKEVLEGLFPLPSNLQELNIWGYKWEPYFSEELFPQNLESLSFGAFDKIVSLPKGLLEHLTSLKSLKINSCEGLKRLGIQGGGVNHPNTSSSSHLQSYPLRVIRISNCPELVFSEEDFQQLNALEILSLIDLPRLTVLPQGIQHLPMLRGLVIWNCSNLKMLPEWIKHLTALKSLNIVSCHEELHKRCEKEKGEDWHLISQFSDISNDVINWFAL